MSAGEPKSNFIDIQVKAVSPNGAKLTSKLVSVFPDTGANICLAGPVQLQTLGIKQKHMTPCSVRIAVAGGSHVTSKRKIKLQLFLNGRTTEQFTYFLQKADRFFLSRQACIGLGMIPASFPHPQPEEQSTPLEVHAVQSDA